MKITAFSEVIAADPINELIRQNQLKCFHSTYKLRILVSLFLKDLILSPTLHPHCCHLKFSRKRKQRLKIISIDRVQVNSYDSQIHALLSIVCLSKSLKCAKHESLKCCELACRLLMPV